MLGDEGVSKIILVTGGARSGKSKFAEELIKKRANNTVYIATCEPFDDELKSRVQKHRESRPSSWETYEIYDKVHSKIDEIAKSNQTVLLDCITLMVNNLMFHQDNIDFEHISSEQIDKIEEYIQQEFKQLIEEIRKTDLYVVFVTNEIGMSIVAANKLSRIYTDIVGRINQLVAAKSDEVYFVVSGIPMQIKGEQE